MYPSLPSSYNKVLCLFIELCSHKADIYLGDLFSLLDQGLIKNDTWVILFERCQGGMGQLSIVMWIKSTL